MRLNAKETVGSFGRRKLICNKIITRKVWRGVGVGGWGGYTPKKNTIGCIPPNNIPQTTIVAFGAITNAWTVSFYIHIMDIHTTASHL